MWFGWNFVIGTVLVEIWQRGVWYLVGLVD
jgi:hypothetical protein